MAKRGLLAKAVKQAGAFINKEQWKEHLQDGSLLFMPKIKGTDAGYIHIGYEAYDTLCVIADKVLERNSWQSQVSADDAELLSNLVYDHQAALLSD